LAKKDDKIRLSESEKQIAVNKLKANEAEMLQIEHALSMATAAKTRSEEEKRSLATENAALRKLVRTVM